MWLSNILKTFILYYIIIIIDKSKFKFNKLDIFDNNYVIYLQPLISIKLYKYFLNLNLDKLSLFIYIIFIKYIKNLFIILYYYNI